MRCAMSARWRALLAESARDRANLAANGTRVNARGCAAVTSVRKHSRARERVTACYL